MASPLYHPDDDPQVNFFTFMREAIDRFVEDSAEKFCADMERERPGGEEWDDHRRRVMADFVAWSKAQGYVRVTPKNPDLGLRDQPSGQGGAPVGG